jgi:flagellar FliJ protein
MQSLLELARHDEQAALEALGESSRTVDANIHQLEELQRYQAEYRQQMLEQGESGFSGARMQQYQQFLYKLDEVITHQREQIVFSEQLQEQRREEWLQRRTRSNALDKVTLRYQESEAQEDQRKEQKESDEMAQQRHELSGQDS